MLKSMKRSDVLLRLPEPAAVRAAIAAAARFVALGALAFALSRATFPCGVAVVAPMAMALFAAGLRVGASVPAMLLGCIAGAWNGRLDGFNLTLPVGCAVILGGSLAAATLWPGFRELPTANGPEPRDQARSPNRLMPALAGLAVLVPGLVLSEVVQMNPRTLALVSNVALSTNPASQAMAACQAVLAGCTAAAAEPFLAAALKLSLRRSSLLVEERIGLAALWAGVCAGVFRLYAPLGCGLAALGTLLAWPAGAGMGAALGMGLMIASGSAAPMAAAVLCGGAAQLCAGVPALLRALCGGLAGAGASVLVGLPLPQAAGLALAAPVYALLPRTWTAQAARWMGRPAPAFDPDRLASALRAQSNRRLNALAAAFGELAEGYLTSEPLPDEQALLARLREALCRDCPGYGDCWAGESNDGARLLCDLIGMVVCQGDTAEALFCDGVPPELARRCRRARVLPERLGELLVDFVENRRETLRRGGENRLISEQFLQAQRLLEGLAAEQSRPVRLRDRQAQRAVAILEREGMPIADAMMLGGPRPALMLTLRGGAWTSAQAQAAARWLSGAFGRVYAPERRAGATLHLARLPRLRADVGAACVSSRAGVPSGDSHAVTLLDGDRLLALICDGMGSGEAAARESAGAVRLLGRFLAAGAEWPLAVETVNAMMLNQSAEEMFATADLLILDLAAGVAEFVKLSACPSLIARGGAIRRVEGGRLPLGILEGVQPAAQRVQLMPGDVVLMMSDGVMDAAPPGVIEDALADPGDDMDALAERIIALADAAAPVHRDDMTVLCVRVGENDIDDIDT